jgi:hypothetical protein
MTPPTWTLHTFQLSDLTDYFKNPRSLSKDQFSQLKTSLDKFGMIDKPIVNLDMVVIGGHQRLHVLRAEGVKECECWIPSRLLTEREVEELNVRLNANVGRWDFDILANNFDVPDLLDWGFTEKELGMDVANNIQFDQYDGNGDGGHSRIQNGTKVRVVIGALMFDIDDPDHSIYEITKNADQDAAKDSILSFISEGGLA